MNDNNNKKYTYFLYARKSSESEDRQIQSIDDQMTRLKELARSQGIQITEIFTEAKSAKKPNNRPIFDEMVKRIEKGEAEGILCWQINRLSRNPIDSARVQWLLQQGILKSIQTIDREYRPDDNVLLYNVESGMANQYILDLSKNVKRGNQGKLEKGWRPGSAPMGYMNELREHTILEDPERFNLLRKCWDLLLTGVYTVHQINDKLNREWGFLTPKKKRMGNNPLSLSGLYAIFNNLFYAGIIVHNGKEYPGKHKAMITLDEYEQAQVILGRKGKPRPQKHHFSFTGMIRCGECGCTITAEKKKKLNKKTGNLRYYTYYHCTRRKQHIQCTQRKVISEPELDSQILEQISNLTILPEFKDWAMEALRENNDLEIEDRTKIYEMQHKQVTELQGQLDRLTKMRVRELISEEMFIMQRDELQEQIKETQKNLRQTEERAENWLEVVEEELQFAVNAKTRFTTGDLETKKEILAGLGSNFLLKDKKLTIEANKWFIPIIEGYSKLEAEYLRLEPPILASNKAKTEALSSVITHWQARQESNLRIRFWRP